MMVILLETVLLKNNNMFTLTSATRLTSPAHCRAAQHPSKAHTRLPELKGKETPPLAAGCRRHVHGLAHAIYDPAIGINLDKHGPKGLKLSTVDAQLLQVHMQVIVSRFVRRNCKPVADVGRCVGQCAHDSCHIRRMGHASQRGVNGARQGPLF